jgi:hypothetical protein
MPLAEVPDAAAEIAEVVRIRSALNPGASSPYSAARIRPRRMMSRVERFPGSSLSLGIVA